MIINDLFNNKKQDVAEGRFVRGPGGVPLDRQGRPVAPKAPKAEPMRMRQWVVHHEGQRGEGGEMIIDAPNFETAWELANEYDLDIIDIKPVKGVAEGSLEEVSQQTLQSYRKKASAQKRAADDVVSGDADDETWKKNVSLSAKRRQGIDAANKRLGVAEGFKMARADKSAKAPKPKNQQEYDAVEKYRKDLAQSYNKEPNFGIKDDEEENKWWIDYDLDEGVAEGLPQTLRKVVPGYAKREIDRKIDAEKFGRTDVDRDANYYRYKKIQDKIKEQGVSESMADDMAAMAQKKFPNAYISKNGQEVQKPENWGKPYTPPAAAPADLEKQQRELTAKYPNIDELVRKAELNRDPDYEMADGQAYYAARDAEQNYQKLRQIQRVIQGLNESLDRSHLP
jgi:hypothetical protein